MMYIIQHFQIYICLNFVAMEELVEIMKIVVELFMDVD